MNRLAIARAGMLAIAMYSFSNGEDTASMPAANHLIIDHAQVIAVDDVRIPVLMDGQIAKLLVTPGDTVQKGQLLFELRSDEARNAVEAAELEVELARLIANDTTAVELAEARLRTTESRLQRLQDARQRSQASISFDEIEQARFNVTEASSELKSARHNVQKAKLTVEMKKRNLAIQRELLDRHRATSPLEGVVIDAHLQVGEWARQGDSMLQIVDSNLLRVDANVDVGQLVHMREGIEATLLVDDSSGGDTPISLTGRITFISPVTQAVTQQVRVWVEFDNPKGLVRPGARGKLFVNSSGRPAELGASKR